MPNFLEYLRQQNIFGPPGGIIGNDLPSQGGFTGQIQAPPSPFLGNIPSESPYGRIDFGPTGLYEGTQIPGEISPNLQTPPTNKDYDMATRMRELYQPTSEATEQFQNMLSQYPQYQNPGWLTRIGAMLQDYRNGPQAGRAVYEEPYRRQVEAWKNQIGPMQAAANLERQENVNARTLAFQQVSAELRDKALEAKEKNDMINARIRQQRADVYEFKARNPQMKIIQPKGGFVTAVNPMTGQSTLIKDFEGNPISSGTLTETDSLNLQQENRLEQIAAGGYQARETEGVRQQGRETIAETRGWQIYNIPDPTNPGQIKAVKINAITGEVQDVTQGAARTPIGGVARPSGAGAGKPETAANRKVREYLLARELYMTRPDLRPFITLDNAGPNSFKIDIPTTPNKLMGSWGKQGPNKEQYDEIQNYIYSKKPLTATANPKYGEENYNEVTGGEAATKPRILSITPIK